jgi:hypothetical protein
MDGKYGVVVDAAVAASLVISVTLIRSSNAVFPEPSSPKMIMESLGGAKYD